MLNLFHELISNSDKAAVFIASFSALIAAISAIIAIISIIQNQKHYKDGLEPQLSMNLCEFSPLIYLRIKNTGKSAAKYINVDVIAIHNNGSSTDLMLDKLFERPFELYPEETVQGQVALSGTNVAEQIFPSVDIQVSYKREGYRKKREYKRSVTFTTAYNDKISADINFDTKNIESSLKCISRASVRTANYLDGRQVGSFDELEILAGESLRNDLHEVYGQSKVSVKSRTDTIQEAASIQKKTEVSDHADT